MLNLPTSLILNRHNVQTTPAHTTYQLLPFDNYHEIVTCPDLAPDTPSAERCCSGSRPMKAVKALDIQRGQRLVLYHGSTREPCSGRFWTYVAPESRDELHVHIPSLFGPSSPSFRGLKVMNLRPDREHFPPEPVQHEAGASSDSEVEHESRVLESDELRYRAAGPPGTMFHRLMRQHIDAMDRANNRHSPSETPNAQHLGGQHSNGQPLDGELNGQYLNSELNGRFMNVELSNGHHRNVEHSNGQYLNGQHFSSEHANRRHSSGSEDSLDDHWVRL